MLTTSTMESDLTRASEPGVNSYVTKPVNFNEFVIAVSKLGVFWAVMNEPPPGSVRVLPPLQ